MSIIQKLQALSKSEYALIFELQTAQYLITVREKFPHRWLQMGGSAIQSLVDLENPKHILSPVNQAMLMALLYVEYPKSVLMLGSGGGSFERFFCAYDADIQLTSVENNQHVIALAYEHLFFPPHINIIHDRADHFLVEWPHIFNIILCDIFEGEQHPRCLSTPLFYQQLKTRLDANGVVAINLLTNNHQRLIDVLIAARSVFCWTALFLVPEHYNAVLFVGNQILLPNPNVRGREQLNAYLPEFDVDQSFLQIQQLPDKPLKHFT